MPPLQSLATYTVEDEARGGVLGVYQSVVSLATIISTASGGFIFAFSPTMPFWVGATLTAVALAPAALLVRKSLSTRADDREGDSDGSEDAYPTAGETEQPVLHAD